MQAFMMLFTNLIHNMKLTSVYIDYYYSLGFLDTRYTVILRQAMSNALITGTCYIHCNLGGTGNSLHFWKVTEIRI